MPNHQIHIYCALFVCLALFHMLFMCSHYLFWKYTIKPIYFNSSEEKDSVGIKGWCILSNVIFWYILIYFKNVNIGNLLNCVCTCVCDDLNSWSAWMGGYFKENPLKWNLFCTQKPSMLGCDTSFSPKNQLLSEPRETV